MATRAVIVTALTACFILAAGHPPANPKPPSPPPGDMTSDSGKLPADILCSVYGGEHCRGSVDSGPKRRPTAVSGGPRHRSRRQEGENDSVLDQAQICSIFGGPTCPADENKVYSACACPAGASGGCECVPYYQCDNVTGEFNQDGVGVIDIRQKQDGPCEHYLHQCCKIREGSGPDGSSGPGPGPIPDPQTPRPSTDPPSEGPNPMTVPRCGVRNRGGVGSRIQGALHDETQFGEIPWMVAIFRKRQSDREYLCGGGLIAPNVVLTAAHCINDKSASSLTVRVGEWDSRTEDEAFKHQDRDVAEVITHPDYKELALHNDIGILVLSDPVSVGYHIGTICLPEQNHNFDFADCLVSGWGKDVFGKEGVYQNILRRIEDLPVVPHSKCQDQLRLTRLGPYFRLNPSFMCAGGVKGKDACTGDGGSPLVCPMSNDDDARYTFAGIVAWGVGCGEQDVPGVYVNVGLFRSWIDQQLADRQIRLPSR